MKRLLSIALSLVMVCSFAGCQSGSNSASNATNTGKKDTSPITVGVCMVQSGSLAGIAPYLVSTIKMATEDVNKNGGINGRKINLVLRDDQGQVSLVSQRLNELKAAGAQVIIGPLLDTQAPAAAKWAGQNKIPVLSTCTLSTSVSISNYNKYIFTTGPSAWAEARVMEKYVQDNKIKSVYFIGSQGGVVTDNYNFFWDEMKKEDPSVKNLGITWVNMGANDFSTIIPAVLAKNPDLVCFDAGASMGSFIQQGIQYKLFDKTKVFGFDMLSPSLTKQYGQNFPKSIVDCTWMPDFVQKDSINKYVSEFKTYTKGLYPFSLTIQCHNAALAAFAGIKACGDTITPDTIAEKMASVSFESPVGKAQFRPFDHQLVFPLAYATSSYVSSVGFYGDGPLTVVDSAWPTQSEFEAYKKSHG